MSFIPGGGYQVTSNSSSVALGVGATFTGDWETTSQSEGLIQCFANVIGTLYVDFSVDRVNADSTFPVSGWNVAAATPEVHRFVIAPGRYFRVRYVNGPTLQTTFRLGTYVGQIGQLSAPLNNPYSLDSDSTIVRPTWTWLDVSRGLATGIKSYKKFGRNSSVGTTFAPVCFGGNYQTPQSSAATTLRIAAGGNANDTAAGSGAREIFLEGLDDNFDYVSEAIATNGASASAATTTTFTRLMFATVSASGTYATSAAGSHAGTITIEDSAGANTWAVVDATNFPKSRSEIGAFSNSRTTTCYVKLRNVSIDSGKVVDLIFFSRANIDQTSAPYSPMRAQSVVSGVSGGSIETFGSIDVPFGPFDGPHDFGFMAKVSSGTASVSVEFEIIEVAE